MQLVEPLVFVAYYWVCLFCTEERLWAIFASVATGTSWFEPGICGRRRRGDPALRRGAAAELRSYASACFADMQRARRPTRGLRLGATPTTASGARPGSFVTLLLGAAVTTALTRRIKAEKPTARLACARVRGPPRTAAGAGCAGARGLFHAASFLPPACGAEPPGRWRSRACWPRTRHCPTAGPCRRRAGPRPRRRHVRLARRAAFLVLRLVSHVVGAARARKQGTTTRPAGYDLRDCPQRAAAPLYVAGPVVAFDAFRNSKSKPISGSDVPTRCARSSWAASSNWC